jgi:hypothetical protein
MTDLATTIIIPEAGIEYTRRYSAPLNIFLMCVIEKVGTDNDGNDIVEPGFRIVTAADAMAAGWDTLTRLNAIQIILTVPIDDIFEKAIEVIRIQKSLNDIERERWENNNVDD